MFDRNERWRLLNELRDAAIADNEVCWRFSQLDTGREAFWRRITYRTVLPRLRRWRDFFGRLPFCSPSRVKPRSQQRSGWRLQKSPMRLVKMVG